MIEKEISVNTNLATVRNKHLLFLEKSIGCHITLKIRKNRHLRDCHG